MRLLTEQRQHSDDVYNAARREAWRHCLGALQIYVLGEARQPLWDLVQCAQAVVERGPGRSKEHVAGLARLDTYAQWAKSAIFVADNPEKACDGVFGELRRLRAAVQEQAQLMHAAHGATDRGPCRCPGCELIRALDRTPAPLLAKLETTPAAA